MAQCLNCPKGCIGLPRWFSGKETSCQCRRHRFDPWVGKIPWRRKWQPTPVFLPGEFQGQRSLACYSQWCRKESDTTEQLSTHQCIPSIIHSLLHPTLEECTDFLCFCEWILSVLVLVSYCCITSYYKSKSLKQHSLLSAQFCRSEVWVGSTTFYVKISQGWNQDDS